MSKRKIVDEELDLDDLEEEEVETLPPSASPLPPPLQGASQNPTDLGEEKADYTLGQWNGREQFNCAHCAFDTLIKDEMIEHLFWVHSIMIEEKEN